ncbi:MAG: hypothetical protein M3Y70_07110 [Pseudomonadota bacterium]|nr:hypothetical protein [Pseudomonadota bacterium]
MDPIPLEDLALLDVLRRIDGAQMVEGDGELLPRLIESGLVAEDPEWPRLTVAGVELCKSLQHRLAADIQAAKVLEQRDAGDADGTRDHLPGDGNGDGRQDSVEASRTS